MNDDRNIAVYVDFENVALGLRGRERPNFDIGLVLQRLLDKGRILVKNAYCDWSRFKTSRGPLHEAGFVLVEIPHLRQSGKNSADIRMVVDALDLNYTREHINTYALVTGDSDFTPLVGKLREHGKEVIGIGVKDSSSALLIESCDEFIYYDDLVQRTVKATRPTRKRRSSKPSGSAAGEASKASVDSKDNGESKDSIEAKRFEGIQLVVQTAQNLLSDRGEAVWASHVKQVLKRKQPNFLESSYGFRNFGELLQAAVDEDWLTTERDDRSGGYRILEAGE